MIVSKCPYPHHDEIPHSPNWSPQQNIRHIFQELQSWVSMIIDTPEKEQALFAYRIFQFGENISQLQSQLWVYIEWMRDMPDRYKNLADEIWVVLKKYGEHFFLAIEKDPLVRKRLVAWLETFHAFIKRAVLFAERDENNIRIFPYKNAVQFASTSIERARMMAIDPDIKWWESLFFDPDIDISKQYLGYPISRPIYRCPILYSGKFRETIDVYFAILCEVWSISKDTPAQVDWNDNSR